MQGTQVRKNQLVFFSFGLEESVEHKKKCHKNQSKMLSKIKVKGKILVTFNIGHYVCNSTYSPDQLTDD